MIGSDSVSPPPLADLTEVAPGVWAYSQPDGGWCVNNVGIITGGGQTCLLDTTGTQTRTEALIAAIQDLDLPSPRWIVNTHSHGDHTFGNHMFPSASIVGRRGCREEVIHAGHHLQTLWPSVQWGSITIRPPELVVDHAASLWLGETVVELIPLAVAHSTNDLSAWLPRDRVLFTGDVAMSGVTPFCLMGSVQGSIDALRQLVALDPAVVVPGHGVPGGQEILHQNIEYYEMVLHVAREARTREISPLEGMALVPDGEHLNWVDPERTVANVRRAMAPEALGQATGPESVDRFRATVSNAFADMASWKGGDLTSEA